jgi:hypothetical protein
VGTNPGTINANSMLEVESTNKGLLLPRLALTSTAAFAPLSAHVAGMAIYNTATVNDVTPGYYYNDGTKWVRIGTLSSSTNIYNSNGTLSGHRTLTQGSNVLTFSGTGNIILNSGNVGIGIAGPSAKLDVAASATSNESPIIRVFNSAPAATGNPAFINYKSHGQDVGGGSWYGGSIQNSSTVTDNNFEFRYGTGGAHVTALAMTPALNVGIGTRTPAAKLDVAGNMRIGTTASAASSDSILTINASTGLVNKRTVNSLATSVAASIPTLYSANGTLAGARTVTTAGFGLTFVSGAANKITYIATGRTGTEAEYGVAGGTNQGLTGTSAGDIFLKTYTSSRLFLGTKGTADIAFVTNDTERMRITSGGNVGIGISSPTTQLDVAGNVRLRTIPSGLITDSILTADANGNIRKISQNTASQSYKIIAQGDITNIDLPEGHIATVSNYNEVFTFGSALPSHFSGNVWTAPKTGRYKVKALLSANVTGGSGNNSAVADLWIGKNGQSQNTWAIGSATLNLRGTLIVERILTVNQGETLQAVMQMCLGCGPTNWTGSRQYLEIEYVE